MIPGTPAMPLEVSIRTPEGGKLLAKIQVVSEGLRQEQQRDGQVQGCAVQLKE
jgi:hypothetical protein